MNVNRLHERCPLKKLFCILQNQIEVFSDLPTHFQQFILRKWPSGVSLIFLFRNDSGHVVRDDDLSRWCQEAVGSE